MSMPWRKLWEWCSVDGLAASSLVVALSVIGGGSYWIGARHTDLARNLAHERELRKHEVAHERQLRKHEVAIERELRKYEVAIERELRESEVRALQSQLKMQQEAAKKMMDDAV